ncbi:MAG: glycosyltransferase family 39 protein [Dehalococcoidales bacterium]|nr:glycosyltransferase family 39 protein [Dehalococcoidales bacterium]
MVDMEVAKRGLRRIVRWEYFWLLLIVIATLVVHFVIINNPAEAVFDEQHYVKDARLILAGEGSERVEHPPLGKLIVAFGMYLFGDKPFGWRIFPIAFGTAGIILFYLICRELEMSRRTSTLATFLLATENLTFIQASIGMLDVFSVTLMLALFYSYLKKNYPIMAVFMCLAVLAKVTAALSFPAIGLHWLLFRRDRSLHFALSLFLSWLLFVMLFLLLDSIIFRKIIDPFYELGRLYSMSGSLTFENATHPFASRPWVWVIIPYLVPYWYIPHYTGSVSFGLWGAIIPTFAYLGYWAWKRSPAEVFGFLWFFSTFLLWIPLDLITDRITYPYYFYPSIGAICIGLGIILNNFIHFWQVKRSGKRRWLAITAVTLFLLAHIGIFVTLSPITDYWKFPIPEAAPATTTLEITSEAIPESN